jgi:hypothetical protein
MVGQPGAEARVRVARSDRRRRSEAIEALTHTPTEELVERRAQLQAAAQDAGLSPNEIEAVLAARPDLPRPLLPIERDTLLAILGYADFEGRDELVAQVDLATVDGYCGCGCATVNLRVKPNAPRAQTALHTCPNVASVLDAKGEVIGGIIISLVDGYLSGLEIWDVLDPRGISPLPPIDRLMLAVEHP